MEEAGKYRLLVEVYVNNALHHYHYRNVPSGTDVIEFDEKFKLDIVGRHTIYLDVDIVPI